MEQIQRDIKHLIDIVGRIDERVKAMAGSYKGMVEKVDELETYHHDHNERLNALENMNKGWFKFFDNLIKVLVGVGVAYITFKMGVH